MLNLQQCYRKFFFIFSQTLHKENVLKPLGIATRCIFFIFLRYQTLCKLDNIFIAFYLTRNFIIARFFFNIFEKLFFFVKIKL